MAWPFSKKIHEVIDKQNESELARAQSKVKETEMKIKRIKEDINIHANVCGMKADDYCKSSQKGKALSNDLFHAQALLQTQKEKVHALTVRAGKF